MSLIERKNFTYNAFSDLISEKEFNEHIILYDNYVKKSNALMEWFKQPNNKDNDDEFWAKKQLQTFNNNGVKLHEMYFGNICRHHEENLLPRIKEFFLHRFHVEFDIWKEDFARSCAGAKGWCIYGYNSITKEYENITLDAHNLGFVYDFKPMIVCDLYEHAYFMDYGTNKKEYVEKFVDCIDWPIIEGRIQDLWD